MKSRSPAWPLLLTWNDSLLKAATPPLVGLALAWVLTINRLLPGSMGFSVDGLAKLLDILEYKLPFIGWMIKHRRIGNWLFWLVRSPGAQRLWLRRQVFGLRWRDRLPWARPAPALLVLQEVDTLSGAAAAELQLVARLAPLHQPLLLVMQMPGLAMLVGGFLDVWAEGPDKVQAWVIHEANSLTLSTPGHADAPQGADPDANGLRTLSRLLGWRASGDAERLGHDLLADPPLPTVWSAALVLGSTAQAPMRLNVVPRSDNEPLMQALDQWPGAFASVQKPCSRSSRTSPATNWRPWCARPTPCFWCLEGRRGRANG
jgi:hypothetical protein